MNNTGSTRPRRVRVERNIYKRADGRLEIGFRDSTGKQRWRTVQGGITAARAERDSILGAKGKGERVQPNPRLKFGDAADKWLAEQVAELRPTTQASYRNAAVNHLKPRWGNRRMDHLSVDDAARLVRELRADGLAEWSIAGITKVGARIFKFAQRRMGWHGDSPFALLENGERPKISETPERRPFTDAEFSQTIAAAVEPWKTLFRLASIVGARESELLGLIWADLDLRDPESATIRFTHQADRQGNRVELKTQQSKAVLPLPSAAVLMLLEHRARSPYTGPRSFVFCTHTGKALGQRNVLRALYRAQEKARTAEGAPTFPELFVHDKRGNLVVDENGQHVLGRFKRRDLPPLPDFHSLRHGAAMDCGDAEEAADLLRHRNSNVTRQIYRSHFTDKRREALRARMEARVEATDGSGGQQAATVPEAEVLPLRAAGGTPQ